MSRYINLKHECDYCGELARRPMPEEFPTMWHDGQPITPIRNKTIGIKCAACRWSDFEDLCASQRVSPHNPVKYYP